MAATSRLMVDVADVRSRAAKHFDTHFRRWATERFLEGRRAGDTRAVAVRGAIRLREAYPSAASADGASVISGKAATAAVVRWR